MVIWAISKTWTLRGGLLTRLERLDCISLFSLGARLGEGTESTCVSTLGGLASLQANVIQGLNLTGFVWTVDQDTHHTVTVKFYDREYHRDFHFTDPYLYDKACLSIVMQHLES